MKKRLIVLHPKQTQIFRSNKANRVVVAGRKFGKSTLALAELLRSAMTYKTNVFVAPTYKMAKNTLWSDHIRKFLPPDLIRDINETELKLTLTNGHTIQLFGSEDPDKLRGMNLDFAVLDEFQDFKPSSWEYVIEPNLLATKGRALFMGTPKGRRNILFEQYNMVDPDYQSWHFTSFDSPIIDKSKLEAIKTRLVSQGKEDVWRQEYLAEFTTLAGLIYQNWDRSIHVKEIEITNEGTYALALDRGLENPSGVGFYYFYQKDGDDRCHMFDEIYKSGLTAKELVDLIRLKMGSRSFSMMYADPSAKDFMATANEMGLPILPANKETGGSNEGWVLHGISKCKEWLAKSPIDGEPSFTVSPRCTNFIEEIETYIWDEQPDNELNAKDRPRKLNDHLMDQWRYLVVSYDESANDSDRDPNNIPNDSERFRGRWF